MARYVETEQWKRWARNDLHDADDPAINQALAAAETWLDTACHRRFVLQTLDENDDPVLTARFFPPSSSRHLFIDDCTSVTAVTVDSSTITAGNYQLEPLNGLSNIGETVPYYQLTSLSVPWCTSRGAATISVTGSWGWVAIPPLIIEACYELTKAILEGRDLKFGVVGVGDFGAVGERLPMPVRAAINQYARWDRAGIA